ncbi:MAG: hypothetical protein KDB61_13530, partial [Planctomycetes bacterium]|nr:hypothetical protein [Planctomycetota bacterium]
KDLAFDETHMFLGAPGHGRVTFEPAVKAGVAVEGKPAFRWLDLGRGLQVQTLAHGLPHKGVVAVGIQGADPCACVELRFADSTGAWRQVEAGQADSLGNWNWAGRLPIPTGGRWLVHLDVVGFGTHTFEIENPAQP